MSVSRENLYKLLESTFGTTALDVYKGRADKDADMPYVTYRLDYSSETDIDSEYDVDFKLLVNVWDKSSDMSALESAVKTILDLLSAQNLSNSSLSVWCERERIQEIPDPDEFVKRVEITFNLGTRFKE